MAIKKLIKMQKIYTKTGDDGTTDIGNNKRIAKDDLIIEVYGTIDELNSAIGIVLAYPDTPQEIQIILDRIQKELFAVTQSIIKPNLITQQHISKLEKDIDELNNKLPQLKNFIKPGGNLPAAHCHLARTICRRLERRFIALNRKNKLDKNILSYINRLADLLFVSALLL
jgi:cob(I)alamin adenosyltransferase